MWPLIAMEAISLICLAHLWRRRDARLGQKLGWSIVMLVPLVGPLFYGSVFRPLGPTAYPSTRDGLSDAIGSAGPPVP